MIPIIDHIQITVKDLSIFEPFYDQLMPILGFDINRKSRGQVAAHEFEVVEYIHPLPIFAINSPRSVFKDEIIHRRKPGAIHHLAFKANSIQEVDALYLKVKEIGAKIVNAPKFYPQHGADYYALFFKDLEGIKYEIVFEKREV
ncbi:VOC family protein [Pedobacter nototheniae]|uniref:VOC family protein n=1 Tax=Pedobacter nototheniae TaxID=2488994 RepID=UPI002930B293|nr:VOC family protein [Pedobacter nototheniae]